MSEHTQLIKDVESFIDKYVTLNDDQYRLPLALWIIGTYCYPEFDAYPYLVITSATKRSGKTRLSELVSFACSNPRNFAAMTGPTLFHSIESEQPTLIVDEAEKLSSQGATDMRAVLNVGYRKGQTVPRAYGGKLKEFQTYCPKLFVLIGDVYDTLRDRSIIITMKRAEPRSRFVYQIAKDEGAGLRERIAAGIQATQGAISDAFVAARGLPFLMDRDEEIWQSLFSVAEIWCPHRMKELQVAAVDMATEKTEDSRRYVDLEAKKKMDAEAEAEAAREEYGKRLLLDLRAAFVGHGRVLSTKAAIDVLKAIPVAPWRKFRGTGLDAHDMSNLLSPFGVKPVRIAIGSGRGNQKFYRGYKLSDIERALEKHT